MLQYRLYGGESLPPHLEGFMKAGANIGSVIGQFTFGTIRGRLLLPHLIIPSTQATLRMHSEEKQSVRTFTPSLPKTILTTPTDGKELMLIIIATILTMTTPTGKLSHTSNSESNLP